jgi:hypothetical protein
MTEVPAAIHALERDLREVFGSRLQSLVAYGLRAHEAAAADQHGHQGRPLVHALSVVESLGLEDLRACAAKVESWHKAGLATPLILAAGEFARSLDAFPFEFGAILADHQVVSGRNPFDGLRVETSDLRRACEVQGRSHLLHLREGYVETRGRGDALAVLIVRSAPALAGLLEHVARLQGLSTHDLAAAGRQLERSLGTAPNAITDIVKLAGTAEIPSERALQLFPSYLDAMERLVKAVDAQ